MIIYNWTSEIHFKCALFSISDVQTKIRLKISELLIEFVNLKIQKVSLQKKSVSMWYFINKVTSSKVYSKYIKL